jgi:hypothetical protein
VPNFDYDIAISCLAEDERIARRFVDVLGKRSKVFLYSDYQKELALKNGVELFTDIFLKRARLNVVFFREGWGETRWTKIEQNAIQQRAFEGDWNSVAVVALAASKGRATPTWVPPQWIYVDYEKQSLETAAAIIEHKLREIGGRPREETARERSNRLLREAQLEEARRTFLQSKYGVEAAGQELDKLFGILEIEIKGMQADDPPRTIEFERDSQEFRCGIRTPKAGTSIGWYFSYANMLSGSGLAIHEFARPFFLDGYYAGHGKRDAVRKDEFVFTLTGDQRYGWTSKTDTSVVLSTEQLADEVLTSIIERTHEAIKKAKSIYHEDDED